MHSELSARGPSGEDMRGACNKLELLIITNNSNTNCNIYSNYNNTTNYTDNTNNDDNTNHTTPSPPTKSFPTKSS